MTNIVFLVRDRFRLTEQGLESLYAHTKLEDFNLTIVDDQSEDFRVRRLLAKFGAKPNATLIRLETSAHVLARAKNIGVAWSEQTFGRRDWLYISDSDVYFMPNWLEKLTIFATMTEGDDFRLWGGQVHPYHHPIPNSAWNDYFVLDGPSWLLRWHMWTPMDPSCAPGTCKGEDGSWCDRLRLSGGRIGVVDPHVVIHTGLTNTAGEDAPGRKARESMIPEGVLAE